MSRTLKLTLAYDGANFSGWQIQPARITVQGLLADALARTTGERLLPQGSGRTDAGVHALAQVASLELESPIPARGLRLALNALLPPAVRVLTIEEAPSGFHARHSATAKTYQYRIYRGEVCPPFVARYVWHYPYPLDESAMLAAAMLVEGEHDFTSFAAADPEKPAGGDNSHQVENSSGSNPAGPEQKEARRLTAGRTCVRTIFASRWQRSGDELIYTVRGSGFLHHMVRNLVGAFILIGKGTLTAADFPRILAARNRSTNPAATAPASGLFLVSVEYQ